MKLGVFGGTFDPIHDGHIKLISSAMFEQGLDAVAIVPAGTPYHKDERIVSPAIYRYELCKKAVKRLNNVVLSDAEIVRKGNSYTADTVRELSEYSSEAPLCLIFGSDVIFEIREWMEPAEIFKNARLVFAIRPGDRMTEIEAAKGSLEKEFGANITFLKMDALNISSSKIRRAIRTESKELYSERCGLVKSYLSGKEKALPSDTKLGLKFYKDVGKASEFLKRLDPQVLDFIKKNELYLKEQLLFSLSREERRSLFSYEKKLYKIMSRKRLIHSWNVLFTALEMALRFDADPYKTCVAALIHDSAKELSRKEQLDAFSGEKKRLMEHTNPAILHGPVASELAERIFGIDDEEIKNAVCYHTTLREGAGKIEKIVFLADKIEPGRNFKDLIRIRELSKISLDRAVIECLRGVEAYLLRENLKPHPLSKAALRELCAGMPAVLKNRKEGGEKSGKKK